MVFPQIEDGLMKIMLCSNINWIDACATPSFTLKNMSGSECPCRGESA